MKKEVKNDLFFISTILQNLTGIEKKFYWSCEFRGCNFFEKICPKILFLVLPKIEVFGDIKEILYYHFTSRQIKIGYKIPQLLTSGFSLNIFFNNIKIFCLKFLFEIFFSKPKGYVY